MTGGPRPWPKTERLASRSLNIACLPGVGFLEHPQPEDYAASIRYLVQEAYWRSRLEHDRGGRPTPMSLQARLQATLRRIRWAQG